MKLIDRMERKKKKKYTHTHTWGESTLLSEFQYDLPTPPVNQHRVNKDLYKPL